MPSSVDYDALAATTRVEDITEDVVNQETLRLLRAYDAGLSYLCLWGPEARAEDSEDVVEPGDYFPGSSDELGWLGHFVKNSTSLKRIDMCEGDVFKKCSQQSVERFFEDLGRCSHIERMEFYYADLTKIIHKLGPAMKNSNITRWLIADCYLGPGTNHLQCVSWYEESGGIIHR